LVTPQLRYAFTGERNRFKVHPGVTGA
jgi:hypothetical protein